MRRRGVSTVEVLLALALAALATAGALRLRGRTRERREEAAVQETLRLSMQVLARAVRSAGSGMPPGRVQADEITLYGFRFWNRNPDLFQVIAAEPDVVLAVSDEEGATTLRGSLSDWSAGDVFVLLAPDWTLSCAHRARGIRPPRVEHAPGACAHPVPLAPVRHFAQETTFRVQRDPSSPAGSRLEVRRAPIGNADPIRYPWSLVADGVDDLEIALLLDGGTLSSENDDPRVRDPGRARAVRVTLSAHTGATRGSLSSEIRLRNRD